MWFARKKQTKGSFRWPVARPLTRESDSAAAGEKYLRSFWVSRRGGIYRISLFALAAYGAWNVVGSGHGVLALRAMARAETDLKQQLSERTEENAQVQHQLHESPATELERGVREKYLMSRKGEIVYHLRRTTALDDSLSGSGTEEDSSFSDNE